MTDMLTADQALIARLEARVRDLERELVEKDQQIAGSRHLVDQGMRSLRRQLSPLYKALQQVFGELDELAPEVSAQPAASMGVAGNNNDYWATWKSRLRPAVGRVIDALIETPHLGSTHLAATLRMDPRTVRDALASMRKVGILATSAEGKHSLQIPGGGLG